MLRAYAISFREKWAECLKFTEFSYNNIYQESIRMAPFEALYGKKCRNDLTRLKWETVDILDLISSKKLESKSALFIVI